MHTKRFTTVIALAIAPTLDAQTVSIAPAGYASRPGQHGNAIPWWSGSGVYMQVHDAVDLQYVLPTPVPMLKSLSFRKAIEGSASLPRTVEAQVTLGTTPVTAQNASTVFAQNLGPKPTLVLPFTKIALPELTQLGSPNPQKWFFPFATPYRYGIANGNLCWELRFRNNSSLDTAACDAMSAQSPSFEEMLGHGCTATGQNIPAGIGLRGLDLSRGTFSHRLDRGRPNSAAALFLGLENTRLVLPGACGALETLPLLSVSGKTDTAGTWSVTLNDTQIRTWAPELTIYTQFVFLDPRLPLGFGVSDCSLIRTLPAHHARIWASPRLGGQGNEAATTGSRESIPYGLVTGFGT